MIIMAFVGSDVQAWCLNSQLSTGARHDPRVHWGPRVSLQVSTWEETKAFPCHFPFWITFSLSYYSHTLKCLLFRGLWPMSNCLHCPSQDGEYFVAPRRFLRVPLLPPKYPNFSYHTTETTMLTCTWHFLQCNRKHTRPGVSYLS